MLATLPSTTTPPRRRGRPRDEQLPTKREEQARIVGLVLKGELMVKQAAGAAEVSRRTIARWKARLRADLAPAP